MRAGYPGLSANTARPPKKYRVQPMDSNMAVHFALNDPTKAAFMRDPEYIKAVFRSYIDVKRARGRTNQDILYKLHVIERQLPGYYPQWQAVRQEFGLGPSMHLQKLQQQGLQAIVPELPPPPVGTASSPTRPSRNRPDRAASTRTHRPTSTAPAEEPIAPELRQPPNPEDEPPPPPYSRNDLDPESTQILEQRLAAEAEASRAMPMDTGPAPSPLPVGLARQSSETRLRPSTSRPSPVSPPQSPAAAERYRPPPGPPPGIPRRTSASTSNAPRISRPDTPPSDPEMRRIWEESQLDEATRASLAAKREDDELEQALQLSLAEADRQGAAGPSSAAGSRPTIATVWEDADDSDEVTNSRRISSYNTNTLSPGRAAGSRRTVSDANLQRNTVDGAAQGIGMISITDGWQAGPANVKPSASGSALDPTQIPLARQPSASAILQSNNPFLSAAERQQVSSPAGGEGRPALMLNNGPEADLLGDFATDSSDKHSHPLLSPSKPTPGRPLPPSPSRGTPGSSPPKLNSMVEERYEPPPGPPPPHLRVGAPSRSPALASPPRMVPAHSFDFSTVTGPPLPPRKDFVGMMSPPAHQQSPSPPQQHSTESPTLSNLRAGEDPLELLKKYQIVFLVDDSATMAGEKWQQAQQALAGVAEIAAEYAEQGLDVYFVNSKRVGKELKTTEDIEDLYAGLQPKGAALTAARLETILRDYLNQLERAGAEHTDFRPMNLIVITDGNFARKGAAALQRHASRSSMSKSSPPPPSDPAAVIVAAAQRLDNGGYSASQVGIQFIQVGDDSEAREALQELDDGLQATHGVRDMVDTFPYHGEGLSAGLIVKALLGGVNRRMDEHSAA